MAFEQLVDGHQGTVLRYARALTDSPFDAEDVLQETFIAAWRSAATFSGTGSARGWLLTIARNAARRGARRRAGEPRDFVPLEDLGREAGWGADRDVDDVLEQWENRETLERALNALSETDREILVLRDLEGFSGDETATLLQIPLAAMKTRLHRARLRLAAQLREVTHARS